MFKRGSHVGAVMSFVIFVTFLIFLYTTIQPTIKVQKEKQLFADYLKIEIIKNVSSEIKTTTLKINESTDSTKDCLRIQNIIGEILNGTDLLIKDAFDNVLNYSISGQALTIGVNSSFTKFLKISSSKYLQPSPPFSGVGCDPITQINLGTIKTETQIFEKGILNLFELYKNDYEVLKEYLRIPIGTEFGIAFTYENETTLKTDEEELSTSVYVEETSIKYLDKEGNIKFGFIRIKIW